MDLEPTPSGPKNIIRSEYRPTDDSDPVAAVPVGGGRAPLKPAGSFSPGTPTVATGAASSAPQKPAVFTSESLRKAMGQEMPSEQVVVPAAVAQGSTTGTPASRPAGSTGGAKRDSGNDMNKAFQGQSKSKELQVNRIKEIACAGCRHKIDVSKMTPLSQDNCPSCGAPFQVPCQVGQYLLVKRVASGAMGTVFIAFDEVLHRQVALKIINASPNSNDGLYQSALRESRILASLNHANIAQIYSMSEDQGQPYITMELVDGASVLDMIKKGDSLREIAEMERQADPYWDADRDPRYKDHKPDGRLREGTVLEIILGACEGLAYAYRLGYIHRDLKPGNLLVDRWGATKIIDWGLAELESKQVEGKVMGSPYYMPPEIARGKKADCRGDIFSLGASMFHMLAGVPPYQAPTPKEVILRRFKEAAPDLSDHYGVHPYVSSLVAWMLNVNAEDRPTHYRDLVDKLRKAQERLASGDNSGSGRTGINPSLRR